MSASRARIDGSILKYFNNYRRYIKVYAMCEAKTLMSDFVNCRVVEKNLSNYKN